MLKWNQRLRLPALRFLLILTVQSEVSTDVCGAEWAEQDGNCALQVMISESLLSPAGQTNWWPVKLNVERMWLVYDLKNEICSFTWTLRTLSLSLFLLLVVSLLCLSLSVTAEWLTAVLKSLFRKYSCASFTARRPGHQPGVWRGAVSMITPINFSR